MATKTWQLTGYIIFLFNYYSMGMMAFYPVDTELLLFPPKYSDCRGTIIDNIHRVECITMCYDSTSPVWRTVYSIDTYENCYCFLYNVTHELNKGSCTLCFKDSPMPVSLELNNAVSTLFYVIPSLFCKYLIYQ